MGENSTGGIEFYPVFCPNFKWLDQSRAMLTWLKGSNPMS